MQATQVITKLAEVSHIKIETFRLETFKLTVDVLLTIVYLPIELKVRKTLSVCASYTRIRGKNADGRCVYFNLVKNARI